MLEESFESQLKKITSGTIYTPDTDVWKNVEFALHPKKRKKTILWWLVSLCIMMLVTSIFGYLLPSIKKVSNTKIINATASKNSIKKQKLSPTNSITVTKKEMVILGILDDTFVSKNLPKQESTSIKSYKKSEHLLVEDLPNKKEVFSGIDDSKNTKIDSGKNSITTVHQNADELQNNPNAILAITDTLPTIEQKDSSALQAIEKANKTATKAKRRKQWQHSIQTAYMLSNIINKNLFGIYRQNSQAMANASPTLSLNNNTVKIESLLQPNGLFAFDYLISTPLSKKVNFTTGIGYRNIKFQVSESSFIDSVSSSGQLINRFLISKNKIRYSINYLNIPTLISSNIISKNKQSFGWQAGIQHLILLSQKEQQDEVFIGNFSSIGGANNVIENKYLPLLSGNIYYKLQLKKQKSILFKYELNGSANKFFNKYPKQNNIVNTGLLIEYIF